MSTEVTRMGENGRIVIPATYRKAMRLKPGETLSVRMDEDGLHIQSRRQALEQARSTIRRSIPKSLNLVDELIAMRREEAKRERSGL